MWKQVAPLFVVAVAIGWLMPAQDPLAPATAPVAATPPKSAETPAPANSDWNDVSAGVVLDRKADGHFYAQGNANGAELNFLIDTGASVVALTNDDAQRLGLFWNPSELSMIGRGVNGEVMGKQVVIDRLAIGDIVAEKVPAVIIPDGLHVSLLGQSFLSRVNNVSISGNRMTLKN
jgi:aspartyl protease family protein